MFTVPCNNYVAHIWSWWSFSNWLKVLPILLVGQNLVLFSHFSFSHAKCPCHLTLLYSGWGFGNLCGNFQFYFLSSVMSVIMDSQLPEKGLISQFSIYFPNVNFFLRLHDVQQGSYQKSTSVLLPSSPTEVLLASAFRADCHRFPPSIIIICISCSCTSWLFKDWLITSQIIQALSFPPHFLFLFNFKNLFVFCHFTD